MEPGTDAAAWRPALGRMFLVRLARLQQLRQEWCARLETPPPELVEHALLSTYADCINLGLEAQVRACCGVPENVDEECHGM